MRSKPKAAAIEIAVEIVVVIRERPLYMLIPFRCSEYQLQLGFSLGDGTPTKVGTLNTVRQAIQSLGWLVDLSWPKSLPILCRGNERLNHFGLLKVTVELIQLRQPKVVTGKI